MKRGGGGGVETPSPFPQSPSDFENPTWRLRLTKTPVLQADGFIIPFVTQVYSGKKIRVLTHNTVREPMITEY